MVAIILAGGFGTRLQSIIKDKPKPMAEINGKPFLEYLFQYLIINKITRIILSVGYKHEVISDYFGSNYKGVGISYIVESSPLGTGGAIKKCLLNINEKKAFILNGDSFLNISLSLLNYKYKNSNSPLLLSLKNMKKFDRYGSVEIDNFDNIVGFKEKAYREDGYINGGIYLISTSIFINYNLPEAFSFEKFIQNNFASLHPIGVRSNGYFIDIGIPSDYQRAQIEFQNFL